MRPLLIFPLVLLSTYLSFGQLTYHTGMNPISAPFSSTITAVLGDTLYIDNFSEQYPTASDLQVQVCPLPPAWPVGCQGVTTDYSDGNIKFKIELYSVSVNYATRYYLHCLENCPVVYFVLLGQSGVGLNTQPASTARVLTFPNPVSDRLEIDLQSSIAPVAATVCDLLGNPVAELTLSPGRQAIDVSALHSGVYILQLTGAEHKSSFKVVKQ